MELINNFSEIFLSVWNKGILGVDIFQILIGIGIFLLFLILDKTSSDKRFPPRVLKIFSLSSLHVIQTDIIVSLLAIIKKLNIETF